MGFEDLPVELGAGAISPQPRVRLVDVVGLLLDLDWGVSPLDDPDAMQLYQLLTQDRRHAMLHRAIPAVGSNHHTADGPQ